MLIRNSGEAIGVKASEMRTLVGICLVLSSIMLYSCNRTPAPTSPAAKSQTPPSFSFTGYGSTLDSTYYKVWSDSSWQAFYMDTTIGGTTYAVLEDNTGYLYFYGPSGYDGFWPYGGNLIMFDSTLAPLPDTMVEGKTYTLKTTFTTQGIGYILTDQEVLEDTSSVTVPFGTFSDCLHLQSTASVSGGGQTQTQTAQYWYAKGPSDVKQIYQSSGETILMAYGFVNGRYWGVSSGNELRLLRPGDNVMSSESASRAGSLPDTHSFLRMVLKGAVRDRTR